MCIEGQTSLIISQFLKQTERDIHDGVEITFEYFHYLDFFICQTNCSMRTHF